MDIPTKVDALLVSTLTISINFAPSKLMRVVDPSLQVSYTLYAICNMICMAKNAHPWLHTLIYNYNLEKYVVFCLITQFLNCFNFFVNLSTAPAPVTEPPVDLAVKCESNNCELPHCYCSKDGTIIPGRIDPQKVSRQLFRVTISISVTVTNKSSYSTS